MIRIGQLIWDDWNIEHIKKHKVSVSEVEEACQLVLKTLESYHNRLLVLGKTKKDKLLSIILAPEGKEKYYVVTVRPMSRRERRLIK